jgi:hypothetical protein
MRALLTVPAYGDNSVNDDDIPAFLRVENREPLTPEQQAALDKAMAVASASQRARDDLRALQLATKKEKSRIRIEKLIARKNGDAARMPLSGRAAVAVIHQASTRAPRRHRQCVARSRARGDLQRRQELRISPPLSARLFLRHRDAGGL